MELHLDAHQFLDHLDEKTHKNIVFADGKAKFFLGINLVWVLVNSSNYFADSCGASDIPLTSKVLSIAAIIFCFGVAYPRGGGAKTFTVASLDLLVELLNIAKRIMFIIACCISIVVLIAILQAFSPVLMLLTIAVAGLLRISRINIKECLLIQYASSNFFIARTIKDWLKTMPLSCVDNKGDFVDPVKIAQHYTFESFREQFYGNYKKTWQSKLPYDPITDRSLKLVYNRCITNAEKYRCLVLSIQLTAIAWATAIPNYINQ